jgi:O-antigen/teichoic acid export membrane protein
MIGMQVGMIYSQIGQQFAIAFLWPYEAGIWTNYMTFFTGISVFTGPIIAYLFPLFTELYKKNEQTKIMLVQKYLIRWVILASIGIVIGWWYLSERAAVTFLTEKFRMSGILFKWTSLGMFFVIATRVQFALLAGAWLVQERVRIVLYGTIGWLLMSYLWVQIWWLWWLVASLVITHIYFWGHSLFYLRNKPIKT